MCRSGGDQPTRPSGANCAVMYGSSPGSSTTSTSSPGARTVSAFGTKPALPRGSTEMMRLPSGRSMSATLRPAAGAVSVTSTSMISRSSSGRSSRCTRPWPGTSCSMRLRIRSVAETAGWMPSSLKCWRFRGLLTRAMIRSQRLLLGHLADEDVVLVVAGDGDHQIGAHDAGALEHPELRGVAVLDGVLELLLDREVALAVG